MSETVAPTPGVPESGPASGTTPEAASTSVAPADFSPEPVAAEAPIADAPVAEVAAPEAKPSILSEAVAEKPDEKPPEAPAEQVKAEVKPAEPAAPPTYEPFTVPEGVTLDPERLTGFAGLLGEFEAKVAADPAQAHAAAQEFGQKMLEFGVAEIKEATEQAYQRQVQANAESWQAMQDDWTTAFRDDPEIGKNRAETSLSRMGGLMEMYGQSAGQERLGSLRGILTMTGAGNNIEVLRFVNWAASRLVETSRVVAAPVAKAPVAGSKAARLYKNSVGAA